jgi:hypothetical protein
MPEGEEPSDITLGGWGRNQSCIGTSIIFLLKFPSCGFFISLFEVE